MWLVKVNFAQTVLSKAYLNQSTQSPEVTPKAASNDDEVNEGVKTLTDKLSAALRNISAKEDLVKQHAKVAEEAVSGIHLSHLQMETRVPLEFS